ncbi:MAG: TolC family protein [Candidatus Krumholzibacteriia bacterium]
MSRLSRSAASLLFAWILLGAAPGPGPSVAAALPEPATGLSFDAAVTLLQSRSRPLMAAGDRESRRREERAATRGLRLPAVQLDARATRIDEPIVIDLDAIRTAMLALHPTVPAAAVPPFETQVQDDHFFRAGVELTWPVFTGGAIAAANRAADARVTDAREQTRATEQTLHATLVERYFGLCLAERAADVRRQVLAGMDQHLDAAVRLEAEGMIARAERLHAEVARAEASRSLQAADQDVRLAQAALRTLLDVDADVRPSSGLFVVHELPSLDALQHDAAAANPNLRRLDAQQELAAAALTAERADYFPDVALFARYELYPDDLTLLDPRWAAGVGLRLNVFDGFAREHRVKAARAATSMVSHLKRGAQDDVALLVESGYRRVVKALEQFDTLGATVDLAEENLRVRTRAFEEGVATSLEVVDALNMLSGVKLARLAAARDYVTALADLLAATGHAEDFVDYLNRADLEVAS